MKKRGQFSIFVIIAVLIIGSVIGLYYFNKKNIDSDSADSRLIHDFVENCIKETGINVIYKIGEGGGYYSPKFATDSGVSYYYADGKNYMPLKSDIEKEISLQVSEELSNCIRDFSSFPDFNVSRGNINSKAEIENKSVILNIDYPLSVNKNGRTTKYEKFDSEIPIKFGILYSSADEFIKEQLSHESICISCLVNISIKNDFYVDMSDYSNDTTIFIFRDEKNKINEKEFSLIFANKYKYEEE